MSYQYDFIVVGAGIAGIAIAELLQRSGKKVLLLEAESKLASLASSQHQSWFHTGGLYAIFPTTKIIKSLVKNLDCILHYYGDFPNMNLSKSQHISTTKIDGWFGNSKTYYFYANPNEKEIPLYKKPLWSLATQVAKSRFAWFNNIDFSKSIDSQLSGPCVNWNLNVTSSNRKFDYCFDKKPVVLISQDRSMNSTLIVDDLIKSFLLFGGRVILESKVIKIEKNKIIISDKMKHETAYHAKRFVLATGKFLGDFFCKDQIKVVKSPLLVVAPALSDINFVRLSINSSKIINHFCHKIPEGSYSVIGNAEYYDPNEDINHNFLKLSVLDKVNHFFGSTLNSNNTDLYFGYKTEFPRLSQLRNYQYHLLENNNCILVLPGKFSFAFSLAVNFCKHFGIDPPIKIPKLNEKQPYPISQPLHSSIAANLFQSVTNYSQNEWLEKD